MPINRTIPLPERPEDNIALFRRAQEELHDRTYRVDLPPIQSAPVTQRPTTQRRGLFGRRRVPAQVEEPARQATPREPLQLSSDAVAALIGPYSHSWGRFLHEVGELKPGSPLGRVFPAIKPLGRGQKPGNTFATPLNDAGLIRALDVGHISPEMLHTLASRYPEGELDRNPKTPPDHMLLIRVRGISAEDFDQHESHIRSALLEQSPALRKLAERHGLEFYNDGGAVTAVVRTASPEDQRKAVRARLQDVIDARKRAAEAIRAAEGRRPGKR